MNRFPRRFWTPKEPEQIKNAWGGMFDKYKACRSMFDVKKQEHTGGGDGDADLEQEGNDSGNGA